MLDDHNPVANCSKTALMPFFLVKATDLPHDTGMKAQEKEKFDADYNELLNLVAQKQDKVAFTQIFKHFAPRVKSFLMAKKIEETLAEEIMQDVMVTLWRKAKLFDPEKASASTWIFTIARNRHIDFIRKGARLFYDDPDSVLLTNQEDTLIQSADEIVESKENNKLLKKALKNLPEEQAHLLKKAFFEDKTHAVIAEEEKLPLGTVKSRIRLALIKLQNALHQEGVTGYDD